MSTFEWLLDSYSLAWPVAIFLVWAVFALRIGRRHDVSMEDFPERAEEPQA